MKRVYIHFYSKENLGDDLFVKIVTERYLDTFINISSSKNTFASKISNARFLHLSAILAINSIIGRLTSKRNVLQRKVSAMSDLFIYVGGSIFIESGNIEKWKKEQQFYHDIAVPYYILGSNIGPFSDQDFIPIVEDIISGSRDTCLRDAVSFNLVSNIPQARLSTDIAFTLETNHYTTAADKGRVIISIIDSCKKFSPETAAKYDTSIAEITKRLTEEGYSVTYMSFCKYEGDEKANERILSMLDEDTRPRVDIFNYRGNLEESLQLLASSELIIGSRFHANILGLVFGKKVLPIAYSDKTIDILKDMNFPGQVIDIREIESLDVDAIDFNAIPIVDVSAQKKLAETQFQELDKVLTKKS